MMRCVPWAALVLAAGAAAQDAPPSRALSLELCRAPRLAGTPGSLHAVETVSRVLEEAGFRVELDHRAVLLSLPRRVEVAVYEDSRATLPVLERIDTFDPDARPPGDVPLFNAWTETGEVRAPVVDAGRGTRADFERLTAEGVDLEGTVALCRYGGGYRGIKVELAEEFGCAAVLLFSPSEDDGAERGPTWPEGPWKPPHEAQRGAVGPMALGPGDPSTPGWPSPAPGEDGERLAGDALAERLPGILVAPIGVVHAEAILSRLARRRVAGEDGERVSVPLGPGPVVVRLTIDAPREVRPIVNVIGVLEGEGEGAQVVAGNHRDSWVRGAWDAGSGTVSLLRAAQHLGERARDGWRPPCTIRLAFWDAEESGLIGSTEWAEAHADELRATCVAYVNADTMVGGWRLNASGTPGTEDVLIAAAGRVDEPAAPGREPTGRSLAEAWLADRTVGNPRLGLPGSGSDFTVFLHHLSIPVLDLSLGGVRSGGYHTAFDDFLLMDRFVDPEWAGHEAAGKLLAELLVELAERGGRAVDQEQAARAMAFHARVAAGAIGSELAEELATAFEGLAEVVAASDAGPPAGFLRALEHAPGLEGRPWYRNQLWAPGIEIGYGSETFPRLRAAPDDAARRAAADDLLARIAELRRAWTER